ncbi:MAG: PAS domain S-box protein [Candidatus Saganbacteria bacterium]|nr:PAS domain S-box protein [Candidatus Saganbacteria bacterium]
MKAGAFFRGLKGLEHPERRLGVGSRAEIQAAQALLVALKAAQGLFDFESQVVVPAIQSLRGHIEYLQMDRGRLLAEKTGIEKERDALKIDRDKYLRFFRHAPVGFHTLDKDARIVEVNDKWLELLGYTREEVIGKPIYRFIVKGQRANAKKRFNERMKDGETHTPKAKDRKYLTKDKREIFVETIDTVFYDENGTAVGVQTAFQDVTALRKAQQKMIEQERRAAFGSMSIAVGHRLKNQLGGVGGHFWRAAELETKEKAWLDIIFAFSQTGKQIPEPFWHQLEGLQQEKQKTVEAMKNALAAMGRTAKGTLAFARSGQHQPTVICLQIEMEKIKEGIIPLTEHAAVLLSMEVMVEKKDGFVIAVEDLQDLTMNMVTNAIEAKARNIKVAVSKNEQGEIVLRFTDDGCGMDLSKMPDLLTRPVPSLKADGTGVGLAHVAAFVSEVGGKSSVESAEGKGATFTFTFPRVEYNEPPAAQKAGKAPLAGPGPKAEIPRKDITLVVVDDEPGIPSLVHDIFSGEGFKSVEVFSSAIDALAWYEAGEREVPMIIVSDLTMPKMNGYEFIERILANRKTPVAVVFQSGNPEPKEEEGPLSSLKKQYGVIHFVQKPWEPPVFREVVFDWAAAVLGPIADNKDATKIRDAFFARLSGMVYEKMTSLAEGVLRRISESPEESPLPDEALPAKEALHSFWEELTSVSKIPISSRESQTSLPFPKSLLGDPALQQILETAEPAQAKNLPIYFSFLLSKGLSAKTRTFLRLLDLVFLDQIRHTDLPRLVEEIKQMQQTLSLGENAEGQEAAEIREVYRLLAEEV